MPRDLVAGFDVPVEVTTDERTVALRHAEWDLPALLLANTDDDQGASLQDVTLLGAKQLTEEPRLWVQAASAGLGLPEEPSAIWEAALARVGGLDDWTLHQVSNYVELTRRSRGGRIRSRSSKRWDGRCRRCNCRDTRGISWHGPAKGLTSTSRWKKNFDKLVTERRPLLVKQRPPRQIIEAEELRTQFANVRDDIPAARPPGDRSVHQAPPSWREESAALAELEWEVDGILQVFSGLRQERTISARRRASSSNSRCRTASATPTKNICVS